MSASLLDIKTTTYFCNFIDRYSLSLLLMTANNNKAAAILHSECCSSLCFPSLFAQGENIDTLNGFELTMT